ncbi:MAG: PilT/PilU family type 4a pilus ATPase [Candidatus Omnitrophica bacterium]|nr:PilT/PilU family type 4a pilus ATPase [Candidatus Omnitrophota bacterium]
MLDIMELLKHAIRSNASDLHLSVGCPPRLRINGVVEESLLHSALTVQDIKKVMYGLMKDDQQAEYERLGGINILLDLSTVGRFRADIFKHKGTIAATFRIIPCAIKTLEELHLPPAVADISRTANGLVLVTGSTGVGKTTTLAAIVNLINEKRKCVVLCLEDPIEILHTHKRSIIIQREIGADASSFAVAVDSIRRQNPDVLVIGELKDVESASAALTAAEAGYLVLSTLNATSSTQAIERLMNMFPLPLQGQAWIQLVGCLKSIICQQLIPAKFDEKLIPAVEVIYATKAIRKLIRERKISKLMSVVHASADSGLISMDQAIQKLYRKNMISRDTALLQLKNKASIEEE